MQKRASHKAFTLVEMLIVLSIIGILMTVVIASTGAARAKARDSKRISDMKEIQIGLALYYDVNKSYPATLSVLTQSDQKFLPEIPTDTNGGQYAYVVDNPTAGKYCLGVTLEDLSSVVDNVTACNVNSGANYWAQR